MRDAFGGVFMMRLMLAFIVIFVAFSAVSLNYAKAFRVKNQIIDVVEQMEIQSINDISTYYSRIDTIIENADYNENHCSEGTIEDDSGNVIGECHRGIKIMTNNERSNNDYIYYDIITYGGWNLSSLNMLLALGARDQNSEEPMRGSWAITGEAKVRNYSKTSSTSSQFSDIIKSDRCYGTTWVRVVRCQPESVTNAQCTLTDGRIVFRNSLQVDGTCADLPNAYIPIEGYRCSRDKKERYYVAECQPHELIGAKCKTDSGKIMRIELTPDEGC